MSLVCLSPAVVLITPSTGHCVPNCFLSCVVYHPVALPRRHQRTVVLVEEVTTWGESAVCFSGVLQFSVRAVENISNPLTVLYFSLNVPINASLKESSGMEDADLSYARDNLCADTSQMEDGSAA